MKLSNKCNFPGVGRPLRYPTEPDDKLLKWILVLRDLHFHVSVMSLQKKAKSVNLMVRPLMQAEAGLENSDGFGNSLPLFDAFTAHLNESQSLIIGK